MVTNPANRATVEAFADLVAEAGPPVAGTEVYVTNSETPHVVFGQDWRSRTYDGDYPPDDLLDFLADFKRICDA